MLSMCIFILSIRYLFFVSFPNSLFWIKSPCSSIIRIHVTVSKEGIAFVGLTLSNNVTDAKVALKHPDGCPISHSKFSQGKAYGCTKYLDLTDDTRSQAPHDTKLFKDSYNLRTEVERHFARLEDREAEQTTLHKLHPV